MADHMDNQIPSLAHFARETCPNLWLTSDRMWNEMQKRANGAAVLTNAVNRAGFGTGFPALSREAAIVVRYHLESSVLGADPTMHQSSASSLSELVHELFDLATKPANDQIVRFSAQISDGVLRDLAVLRSGLAKSSVLKWEPAPLGGPELADLLSHNLTVLRGIPSLGSLPDPAEMSLELLYGLILARWHGEAVEEVPESATRPSERRCVSLCSRISSGPWAPDFPDVSPEDSLSLSALRAALEEAVKERRVGATRRKKVRRILRSLERVLEDDAAWEVRRDVVAVAQGTWEEADYRRSGNLDTCLADALAQALDNIPTDIQVANMGTLRKPSLHFLHDFLEKKAQRMTETTEQRLQELDGTFAFLSRLVARMRDVNLFKSDWQNNVARVWSVTREKAISLLRQLGRPQRGAPPPLQYSLALDLVPQAHPFSFTYSRRQGYGLKDGLSQSMSWLRSLANSAEIAHFAAMIAQPPAELGFLAEEWPGVEEVRRCAHAMVEEWESGSGNSGQTVRNLSSAGPFWEAVSKWPAEVEGKPSQAAVVTGRLVDRAREALPAWLQSKVKDEDVVTLSPVSLFFATFEEWPADEAVRAGRFKMSHESQHEVLGSLDSATRNIAIE